MAIDPDFLDCMSATITIASASSVDNYGNPTFGSTTAYSAREVYRNQLVKTPDGQESVSRGVVWLYGAPDVNITDQLTLSDASTPRILTQEKFTDEDGDYFTKVYFG
jgi:hypothetical protein